MEGDLYNRFGIYIARRHVQTEQAAHPSGNYLSPLFAKIGLI